MNMLFYFISLFLPKNTYLVCKCISFRIKTKYIDNLLLSDNSLKKLLIQLLIYCRQQLPRKKKYYINTQQNESIRSLYKLFKMIHLISLPYTIFLFSVRKGYLYLSTFLRLILQIVLRGYFPVLSIEVTCRLQKRNHGVYGDNHFSCHYSGSKGIAIYVRKKQDLRRHDGSRF